MSLQIAGSLVAQAVAARVMPAKLTTAVAGRWAERKFTGELNMEFGVFDHVDRAGTPLQQFFEERIQIAQAYERFGFFCYHIAEHHFTPLGMAASPGIFLSSVAQRTKTLRFGPLVYILPFYHPLRLAEEICMLDHLSGGRLELGIGRGISPVEAAYYGEASDFTVSRETFAETWKIIHDSFSQKRVSFQGKYRHAADVPIELDTLQKPHPPGRDAG